MGLFAFRRMQTREVAAKAAASVPVRKKNKPPKPKHHGDINQRNGG